LPAPPDIPRFRFEPLDKAKHDRAAFSCGSHELDTYLKQQARKDVEKRVTAVFVATSDGKTIAGYYTLSQYAVDAGDLPPEVLEKLRVPKYLLLPATLIGRLARATTHKGQGIGEMLLMSALKRALDHSKQIASLAVVVDAKDEHAARFYSDYGFIKLPEHPNRMFLPIETIGMMFR
jgi:predicted GNAT family N-acyltransferase